MPATRVAYPRATIAYDAEGNELFRAIALWALMDPQSRAMVVPGTSGIAFPGCIVGGALPSPKSLMPKNLPASTDRKVRFGQLDRNGHMNNTKYLDWAMDLLPGAFHREHPLKSFAVCYLNEAREGDRVTLGHGLDETNTLLVDATRPEADDPAKYSRVFAVKAEFA
jgi:acyl-ACP thioesterase